MPTITLQTTTAATEPSTTPAIIQAVNMSSTSRLAPAFDEDMVSDQRRKSLVSADGSTGR